MIDTRSGSLAGTRVTDGCSGRQLSGTTPAHRVIPGYPILAGTWVYLLAIVGVMMTKRYNNVATSLQSFLSHITRIPDGSPSRIPVPAGTEASAESWRQRRRIYEEDWPIYARSCTSNDAEKSHENVLYNGVVKGRRVGVSSI